MNIEVNGNRIETSEEGYLINPDDWDEDVAKALVEQHESAGHKPVSETAWGLITYFREYYRENKVHPAMRQLVLTLGKHHGEHFHEQEAYKTHGSKTTFS